MKNVLGAAVLVAVLGATGLQAAITSKEALNIAEKNFPGSSVKDIEMNVKKGVTFYKKFLKISHSVMKKYPN